MCTPSFCSDNFLHPKNALNSNISSDFLSPNWKAVCKSFISLFLSSIICFLQVDFLPVAISWSLVSTDVQSKYYMWGFVQEYTMCSVLCQMLLLDYILNFDIFLREKYWVCSQLLSWVCKFYSECMFFKYSLDLASYFSKFQSSSVSSEIFEIPLRTLFWD